MEMRSIHNRLITRIYCPATLNFFVNHSKIRENLFQDTDPYYVDCSSLVAKPDTYLLSFPKGLLLFWKNSENIYEADIYCLPLRKRGDIARQAAKEAISLVFSQQNPPVIKAKAPQFNAPSRHFIVSLGFKRTGGIIPGAFLKNGIRHDIVLYELGREKWEALSGQSSEELQEV